MRWINNAATDRYATKLRIYSKLARPHVFPFSALTLLDVRQEEHPACKTLSD